MENLGTFLAIKLPFGTIREYLLSAATFIVILSLIYIIRNILFKKLEELSLKTETDIDDLLVKLLKKIKAPEYQLIAFYCALRHINRTPSFDYALKMFLIIVFTYRLLTIIEEIFSYWIEKLEQDKENPLAALESVKIVFRILLWIVAVLFILHNSGLNIGTLLTSLGIGGVAVALAAQTILGDIFNFFVILLDRPFKKGDFIVLGNTTMGTVEEIGLKSTKIRSLSGELITITNTKVFAEPIQNYALMKERRVVSSISIVQGTTQEKIDRVNEIIKQVISSTENARFDRANMSNLSSYSIDFEFVYYITNPDYNQFMDIKEKIFLGILSALRKEGISLAYPTQTLIIKKD